MTSTDSSGLTFTGINLLCTGHVQKIIVIELSGVENGFSTTMTYSLTPSLQFKVSMLKNVDPGAHKCEKDAVIRYLVVNGKIPIEIVNDFETVYNDGVMIRTNV